MPGDQSPLVTSVRSLNTIGRLSTNRIHPVDCVTCSVHDGLLTARCSRRGVAEVRGELVWSTAKNHERRSVPYPAFLADELVALVRHKGRDDQVFTRGGSVVLRVSTWRPRVFKPAVDRAIAQANELRSAQMLQGLDELTAEFPIVTPHDLRHTAASLAISAGANVKAVQTMLGHKSAALTLDTYADLFPDDLEAVAAALDRARDSALLALRNSPADCVRTGGK